MLRKARWQVWIVGVFLVLALIEVQQHDWAVAGTLLGVVAFRLLLLLADSSGWPQPSFDLQRFRQGIPAEEQMHKPLDPRRLGPIMVAVVLGWEAVVLVVGDLLLGLPTSAVLIGIIAVIPVSLGVGLVLVRRLPPEHH